MNRYKLGELCEIVSGSTPKTNIEEFWDGNIIWITPAELEEDKIVVYDSKRKLTKLGVKSAGLRPFPKGTVILSSRAPIGKIAIAGCEMYCNQGFKNLICSTKVYNFFLYWLLKSKKEYLNLIGRGATFKELSKQIVSGIEINLPNIEKQVKIASILEKVDSLIKLRKQQLKLLDTLVNARFVEMFGDPENSDKYPKIAVKELVDVVSGGTPDRKNREYWDDGTIPWVKTTELKNNRLIEIEEYITEKGLEASAAKIVPKNTVLIAMYGQGKTRGMTAILEVASSTNQACACLLPSNKIESNYLWQYMILSYDRLRKLAQGGNQPNLNGNMIKNFMVLVPPKNAQIVFVDFVAQISKSKLAVQKSLEEAQLLFDSLMQEYFG